MKALLIGLLIQGSLVTAHAKEEQEAKQQAEVVTELKTGLEYMELTPEQIRKRDKILAPIYQNYQTVNLSSVSNALEKIYGMNVYHHMIGKELELKDKKNVMENAVRYYIGDTSLFNQAANGVLLYKESVKLDNSNAYYTYDKFAKIDLDLIEGSDSVFRKQSERNSPSILVTAEAKTTKMLMKRDALYTSVQKPLYTAPVMSNFLEAVKSLNLKALDATVVFANSNQVSDKPYEVVYPNYSKLAPIPQPVIYISKNATAEDISTLIKDHGPRIFAYNKLFNANLLPSVNEINELLIKYPNILKEVEKKAGKVKRENLVNAIQAAFLYVTYGTGILLGAPIALAAMIASPIFCPIFIGAVIIFI